MGSAQTLRSLENPHQDRFLCDIIGRDSAHRWHIRTDVGERIVVLDETGIHHVQNLDEHSTSQWVKWVEENVGWNVCHFQALYEPKGAV